MKILRKYLQFHFLNVFYFSSMSVKDKYVYNVIIFMCVIIRPWTGTGL